MSNLSETNDSQGAAILTNDVAKSSTATSLGGRSSTNSSCSSSTRGKRRRSKDKNLLTVADVYDIAADIGKEFETLIDSHGPDHVKNLMQKVINSLEHLERLASDKDKENQAIDSLQTMVSHLELEENKKQEERQRNARELEQIEDHYKQETRDLLNTVKRLQDENRKLANSLVAANERDSAFSEDETYFEIELVKKLEITIEKQRNEIKKLDQSVIDYKAENEELRCQKEKVAACSRDIRRKLRHTNSQLNLLVDERADLTSKVQDQEREIRQISKQLGLATKECEDLSDVVAHHEKKLTNATQGKLIYDVDDPNRPKFSLPELRKILQERNYLKARVSDLEDELVLYRPEKVDGNQSNVIDSNEANRVRLSSAVNATDCDCSYHSKKNRGTKIANDGDSDDEDDDSDVDDAIECDEARDDEESDTNMEDLPVQGPLPQDPDDAPFRKSESGGIRKLFKYITNRVSTVSQNIVASAEQELPPAFKMRSASVTAYSSTEDGKN